MNLILELWKYLISTVFCCSCLPRKIVAIFVNRINFVIRGYVDVVASILGQIACSVSFQATTIRSGAERDVGHRVLLHGSARQAVNYARGEDDIYHAHSLCQA